MISKKTEATVIWTWREGDKKFVLEVPSVLDRCPTCGVGSNVVGVTLPREIPMLATNIFYQAKIGEIGYTPVEYTDIKKWELT